MTGRKVIHDDHTLREGFREVEIIGLPARCAECSIRLRAERGELFLTDDGRTWCADHYPREDA